jgi:oxalate decarboxylase/phosphoglucose isomerase-like protein (cupin superfamily)
MYTAPTPAAARRAALAILVTLIAVTATGYAASAAAEKEPVRRIVYGQAAPTNAPGQQLFLQRVVLDPGAKLPEHFHEGTQLATIRAGVLTYNVVSGTAVVTRANGSTEQYKGPKVVRLRTGDVLVEDEALAHYGSNKGKKPVVLELAALLRDGAPLSTPVGKGDAGATPLHVETTLSSPSRTLHQVGLNGEKTYGWNLLEGTATVDDQPVQVELQGSVDYTNGSGAFSAFVTFTFADGSTLGTSAQGFASTIERRNATTFAATMLVIGGTGTYASAKGSGTFAGSRTEELGGNVALTFDLGLR